MRKVYYWILIILLILVILGISVFFIWYIQKENIFKKIDNELLVNENINKYIGTSWANDYIYWIDDSEKGVMLKNMKGDGSQQGNVVSNDGIWEGAGNILISPDTNYYAYICSENEKKICLYDLKLKKLSKLDIAKEVSDIKWSSDSSKLIFIAFDKSLAKEDNVIATINIDGSDYREIINSANVPGKPIQPEISPNGESIIFSVEKENGDLGVYMMNYDGSNINAVADSDEKESEAVFSPDGKSIIYTILKDSHQIYQMNLESKEYSQLTFEGNNASAKYSPDGNRIVFISDRDQSGSWEIYIMDIDGSEQERLTENGSNDITPNWFRKKINILKEHKIISGRETLENYLALKISGEETRIKEYINSDNWDNIDLISPYSNLFSNEIKSYNILTENDIEPNIKEFEIELLYQDETLGNEKLAYQINQSDSGWQIVAVRVLETNNEEDISDLEDIQVGNIVNDSTGLENQQSAVDDGNDQWRLDPFEVAKRESDTYGFNQFEDGYTLVSRIDMGDYSGAGEATVEVDHQGIIYIVQLIQPIKQGNDGIWALNSIVKK